MSLWRGIVCLTDGADPGAWKLAALEADATGKPTRCAECPLRKGGEWDTTFAGVLPQLGAVTRAHLTRWSCHQTPRPCSGMRRHLQHKKK